jgi:AAA15 family ATPase/GTPase
MSEHFIKEIEIKNFKCFEDFKAEGFGRVNLIGGKNNVGKTAFMEACYITLQKTKGALLQTFIVRNQRNYINYDRHIELDGMTEPLKELFKQKFEITINHRQQFNYHFKKEIHPTDYIHRKDTKEIFENTQSKIQFLDNGITDVQLESLYAILQEQNKEELLNQYIQEFDSSIKQFKFIRSTPKLEVNDKYIHLSNFGDGLKTYIFIICSLFVSKNGQLFIDEIENGIHYIKLDRLWEIILTISKEQNVQVFATTHSKECIESYARVAKKLEDEEIGFIELGRNKESEIKAMVYPYEWILDEIEQNHEVRGW